MNNFKIAEYVKYLKTKTSIVVLILLIIAGLAYYYKGLFVAATVNGSPISRLSVLSQLEQASGKMALDALITKKLIEAEGANKNISVSAEEIDAEIKNIESRITSQGGTLEKALKDEHMTIERLREQISVNFMIRKLVADRVSVSDEEIEKYIKDNGGAPPKAGTEFKIQIKAQLENQKISQEAQNLIDSLKAKAKIKYFVDY